MDQENLAWYSKIQFKFETDTILDGRHGEILKDPDNKLFTVLICITIGLLAVYTFLVIVGSRIEGGFPEILVDRFDIDKEANIPTWFSTIFLFSVAETSFLIYRLNVRLSPKRSFHRVFWLIFAGMYCFLSIDEAAVIHEIIDQTTSVKWVVVYAPVVGSFFLLCAYYFLVLRKDERVLRNWVIGGLLIYGLGGIGAEWVAYSIELKYALRMIEYVVEEGFEMTGTVMVLMGCLYELRSQFKKLQQTTA